MICTSLPISAVGFSGFGDESFTNKILILADMIDKSTHEIRQDEDKVVYKSLEEVGEDLPDHSPRFILLSYPLTLVSIP